MVVGIAGGIFTAIYSPWHAGTQTLSNSPNLQKSAHDESIRTSDSPLSPLINKEQWHQDPFESLAKQIENQANG